MALVFWGHKCFLDPFNADLLAQAVNHLAASMARSYLSSCICRGGEIAAIFAILVNLPPLPTLNPEK